MVDEWLVCYAHASTKHVCRATLRVKLRIAVVCWLVLGQAMLACYALEPIYEPYDLELYPSDFRRKRPCSLSASPSRRMSGILQIRSASLLDVHCHAAGERAQAAAQLAARLSVVVRRAEALEAALLWFDKHHPGLLHPFVLLKVRTTCRVLPA